MKSFQQIVLEEYFEPSLGKAFRVMLVFVLPLIWGMVTNHTGPAVWIAISAQMLASVTIRGTYPLKLLILGGAVLACAVSASLGILAGHHWTVAAAGMMVLAFLGGFVRQSGDHGPGVTVSVLLLYLLSLDHPGPAPEAAKMFIWVLEGGILAMLSILLVWGLVPFSPFRRSIALTWKALAEWIQTFSEQMVARDTTDPVDKFDEKELALREEMSNSMKTISRKQAIAHARQNRYSFQLVELRRLVSEAGNVVSSLRVLAEALAKKDEFPSKLFQYVLDNFRQAAHRMAVSILTHRFDDVYSAQLSMKRLSESVALFLKEIKKKRFAPENEPMEQALQSLTGCFNEALSILEQTAGQSGKMTFFLHNFLTGMTIPQRIPWVRFEFNTHSFIFRFSLRLALAMGIGITIYKIFNIPHGYWIAMTAMIVLQPEFGATINKALDRTKGTFLGALAGSLVFLLPLPLPVNIAIVAICAFLFPYFLMRNYAVAAFFITVMVVSLFHLMEPVTWQLGVIRVVNTLAGCGLALLGGFAFFPLWERYRFPALIREAIEANRRYLKAVITALQDKSPVRVSDLIKCRRNAEMNNNNAFLSLRRMKSEPEHKQQNIQEYFIITGHSIRITRLLNALNQQIRSMSPASSFSHLEDYYNCMEDIMRKMETIFENETQGDEHVPVEQLIKKIKTIIPENDSAGGISDLFEKMAREIMGMYQTTEKLNFQNR